MRFCAAPVLCCVSWTTEVRPDACVVRTLSERHHHRLVVALIGFSGAKALYRVGLRGKCVARRLGKHC